MAAVYKMIGGDGREYGPATLEEIRQWCEDGRVAHGTPVWRSDEARWQPAGGWDELKWDLPAPPATQPATAARTPPSTVVQVQPAGFWIRVGAYVIDWVILAGLATLVTLPWADEILKLQDAFLAQLKTATPDYAIMGRYWLVSMAINLPLGFTYFTLFNGWRGATPGKQLLGLRILREDGSSLGYLRAFLRYAAELLSALFFGAGYVMVAFHPQKRALHDLLAKTQVIRTR